MASDNPCLNNPHLTPELRKELELASPDRHVESVVAKLRSRSKTGIAKYGVTLERGDLNQLQWLVHAQDEALDCANYLEVLIQREKERIESLGSAVSPRQVRTFVQIDFRKPELGEWCDVDGGIMRCGRDNWTEPRAIYKEVTE